MPHLPLNALRTFEAVASQLSFARGAELLNVSPAAVSSQIRVLEDRLKQPLFIRRGRQIELSEAGRVLLPGVQRGLAEMRQALKALEEERSEGVLNVSMIPAFLQKWVMPRLDSFYRNEDQIDLRINVDDSPVKFEDSDFHAAIPFGSSRWPGLKSCKVMNDWILPVCSRQYFEKSGPFKTFEDLQQHDLLFRDHEIVDPWFREVGEGGRLRRVKLLNDPTSILMAAEQGQGIALARWSLVARDIRAGRLVRPVNKIVKSDGAYYFVAPKHCYDMPKVAAFRDWLLQQAGRFEGPDE